MIWLQGIALVGLAAVAVPFLAHLVSRRPAMRIVFPTLRFFGDPSLRARARRTLGDWPLLAVRTGIVVSAALALAQPLFLPASRLRAANARDVRAIVIDTSASMHRRARESSLPVLDAARARAAKAVAGAHRAEVFEGDDLADALRRAGRWLDTAPPGRQQVVVYTDAQAGTLAGAVAAVAALPAHIGLDVVVLDVAQPDTMLVGRRAIGDRFERRTESLRVSTRDDAELRVGLAHGAPGTPDCVLPVSVEASAAQQALADAVSEAVVSGGVPCAIPGSPGLVVSFSGDDRPVTGSPTMTPAMLDLATRIVDIACTCRLAWSHMDAAR